MFSSAGGEPLSRVHIWKPPTQLTCEWLRRMAPGAREKGKEQAEMKEAMKNVERAMNDMIINFGENVRGEET